MTAISPFSLARFEYEHAHLYYIQEKLFSRLKLAKPVYLVGSRGTGKTTLLKALSWYEQLHNTSLKQQLGDKPSQCIGIYLKLPEIQLNLISRWSAKADEQVHGNVFSHYLDLVWLEQLLLAIPELIAIERISVSPEVEQQCVTNLVDHFFAALPKEDRRPSTLLELARFLRQRREDIELLASVGADVKESISQLRLIHRIGSFGREVADRLVKLCNENCLSNREAEGWLFKICMDEGECLSPTQLIVLNTMVRLSKSPLFFVVSFVSAPSDATTTLVPGLTLQQADRELVPLDKLTESEFRELVEGVATVRINHALGSDDATFRCVRVLGSLDINAMLEDILGESVSPKAHALLADARSNQTTNSEPASVNQAAKGAPPIYETYLAQRLLTPEVSSETKWERRRQESAEARKRFVAAYLSICNDANAAPRYASAEVVLQTSDNCVRDFLSQIDEIYAEAGVSLDVFLKNGIDTKIQDRALKRASLKKYQSLPTFGVNNPTETSALVDGLSKITAQLQSRSPSGKHLRSSERGLFVLGLTGFSDGPPQRLLRSLREAAEAGFLRVLSNDSDPFVVRVHTSLAPHYGFSYRGAYYKVVVDWHVLNRMRTIVEPRLLDDLVATIVASIERTDPQNDLFRAAQDE